MGISWSSDSQEIITASYDSTAKLWDLNKGKLSVNFALSGFIQCVMHNPAGINIEILAILFTQMNFFSF